MTQSQRRQFYRRVLLLLHDSKIPFLVGGAYALTQYTAIVRDTKDLDLFVYPDDCKRLLAFAAGFGYHTELPFPHWLGKIKQNGELIDIIHNSGNGLCRVDRDWFRYSRPAKILDVPVRLVPPEEMIWQKAFIMERLRYDGADVAHLLDAQGDTIDWDRLLERFGEFWPPLLAHLIIYSFIYPGRRSVPMWVQTALLRRMHRRLGAPAGRRRICQGTFLSLLEYLPELERGYVDARLKPIGKMSKEDVETFQAPFLRERRNQVNVTTRG